MSPSSPVARPQKGVESGKGHGLVFFKGTWGPVSEAMEEGRVSGRLLRGGGGLSPAVWLPGSAWFEGR